MKIGHTDDDSKKRFARLTVLWPLKSSRRTANAADSFGVIHIPRYDLDETLFGSVCCRRVGVVLVCGIDLSASRRRKRTKQFFGLRPRRLPPSWLRGDEVAERPRISSVPSLSANSKKRARRLAHRVLVRLSLDRGALHAHLLPRSPSAARRRPATRDGIQSDGLGDFDAVRKRTGSRSQTSSARSAFALGSAQLGVRFTRRRRLSS